MRRMNKKSQLYLLTAIFLSVLVFMMSQLPAKTPPGNDETLHLYNNFVSEAPRTVNSALFQGRNLTSDFEDFVDEFIYYSSTKNINLSVFYVIAEGDSMIISNKAGESVNITTTAGEQVIRNRDLVVMPRKSSIEVELRGISYDFSIKDDLTDIKIIFISSDPGNNIEVYTYG